MAITASAITLFKTQARANMSLYGSGHTDRRSGVRRKPIISSTPDATAVRRNKSDAISPAASRLAIPHSVPPSDSQMAKCQDKAAKKFAKPSINPAAPITKTPTLQPFPSASAQGLSLSNGNPSTLQPFNASTLQLFNPSTLQPFNPSTLQHFNGLTLGSISIRQSSGHRRDKCK
jgi:hypothetical protein